MPVEYRAFVDKKEEAAAAGVVGWVMPYAMAQGTAARRWRGVKVQCRGLCSFIEKRGATVAARLWDRHTACRPCGSTTDQKAGGQQGQLKPKKIKEGRWQPGSTF